MEKQFIIMLDGKVIARGFQFIEDALEDIEKCVEDYKQTILEAKKNIKEGINKGIKDQIDQIFN